MSDLHTFNAHGSDGDDPMITAYALGELEGEAAERMARRIEAEPPLRREVEAIRASAAKLRAAFASEPAAALTLSQRAEVLRRPAAHANQQSANEARRDRWRFPALRSRWVGAGLAAAATIALAATAAVMYFNERSERFAVQERIAADEQADKDPSAIGRLGARQSPPLAVDALSKQEPAAETAGQPAMSAGGAATGADSLADELQRRDGERARERRAAGSPPPPPAPARAIEPSNAPARGAPGAAAQPAASPSLRPNAPRTQTAAPDITATGRGGQESDRGAGGGFAGGGGAGADAAAVDRTRSRIAVRENAEEFAPIVDNPFIPPLGDAALSTFAADVDTASYANVRRMLLTERRLPPPDAVRIEELLNYFRYEYQPPSADDGEAPFRANVEVAPAPWNPANRLVRIGLRGAEVKQEARPATSLVFLIDVSGSMDAREKLPLVKQSLKLLVRELHGDDRLAIVTYAGSAGVALNSVYVNAEHRQRIDEAIDNLRPGGSTNGAGGIAAAYELARRHFIRGGVNRVVLCTDGDFNVGVSSDEELVRLIEQQRASGVFLSVLGFGAGNFKDGKMERLSNAGNGNFAYIDSLDEARKVLVKEMGGTLVTIAKDVKFQVQFNPDLVAEYRLIGYENRLLEARDFADDRKDAGEIGSGHSVTALYEIVPAARGAELAARAAADDRMEAPRDKGEQAVPASAPTEVAADREAPGDAMRDQLKRLPPHQLLELRIRWKQPDGEESRMIAMAASDEGKDLGSASVDFRFAAAVAEFGMLLRQSPYRGQASFANALDRVESAMGEDREGYRRQFMEMVRAARDLDSAATRSHDGP